MRPKVFVTRRIPSPGIEMLMDTCDVTVYEGTQGIDRGELLRSVTDKDGLTVPRAGNRIHFEIEGPGEIVATDNGDPTSFESFQSHDRQAFNGLCLVIIRGKPGQSGKIELTANTDGLKVGTVLVKAIR